MALIIKYVITSKHLIKALLWFLLINILSPFLLFNYNKQKLHTFDEQFEKDTRNFIHDILDSIRHGYDCMQYKESRDNIYERMITKFKNYKWY